MNTRIAKKLLKRAGATEYVHMHVNNGVSTDRLAAACVVWWRAVMRDTRCLRRVDTKRVNIVRYVWENVSKQRIELGDAERAPHRADRFYSSWHALPANRTAIWHALRDRIKVIDYTRDFTERLAP